MKIKSLLFLVLITLICAKQLRFLQEQKYAENGKQMPEEVANIVQAGMQALSVLNQSGAAMYMGYVGLIIDAAATIIDTFKSSNVRTFEKIVPGSGYSTFDAKYEWDFTMGYRWQGYQHWKQQMKELLKVNKADENDFLAELETGGLSKKEIFSSYSIMKDKGEEFETDEKGNKLIHFINVMVYHYRKNCKTKFDAIISQAEIKVKLFPNQLIFRREKSVAGGIEKSATYEREWQDRDFTPKDVDDIVNYFQLATYNELSKNMGIITNIVL